MKKALSAERAFCTENEPSNCEFCVLLFEKKWYIINIVEKCRTVLTVLVREDVENEEKQFSETRKEARNGMILYQNSSYELTCLKKIISLLKKLEEAVIILLRVDTVILQAVVPAGATSV